jgi:hypothetical protein
MGRLFSRLFRLLRGLITVLVTALAISFGLITLAGLLAGESAGVIYDLTTIFLQLASITLGVTVLIGIYNLVNVHTRRVIGRGRGLIYSLTLLVSFFAVIILWLTGQDETNLLLLEAVQVPIESALAALVLFALVYGAYRMMRRGVTWSGILFTVVLLIVLIGALPGESTLSDTRAWLLAIPVSAGQRGILLGIALATIVTGVRVITGQDRSIRE